MALTAAEIKRIKSLHQKKYRKEEVVFIAEGVKTVRELLKSFYNIECIYATETLDFLTDRTDFELVKEKELERISVLKSPNKVLAIARTPQTNLFELTGDLILMLDGIRDPGNLGTIIRTAKWFGVEQIICSEDCTEAFSPKVVQSTMGALFHTQITYTGLAGAIERCKANGYKILGATMTGASIGADTFGTKNALVIGSESHGISAEVLPQLDAEVTIENYEDERRIESLNAGIATAVLLNEFVRNTKA